VTDPVITTRAQLEALIATVATEHQPHPGTHCTCGYWNPMVIIAYVVGSKLSSRRKTPGPDQPFGKTVEIVGPTAAALANYRHRENLSAEDAIRDAAILANTISELRNNGGKILAVDSDARVVDLGLPPVGEADAQDSSA